MRTSHYALEQTEQALLAAKNDPRNSKPVIIPGYTGDK
jgi:hypothetical protein